MPTVKLSPVFNDQTFTAAGLTASGYQLFAYAVGSSTKQTSYSDSAGAVPQSNPIILNASGYPTAGPIWLTAGLTYKFVLALSTDTDPPASPVKTIDGVTGVNDFSTVSQWISSGGAPTYINATSFSLVGDQTTEFHVGRRVRATVSAGTLYGVITASSYTSLTTVTVVLDSGVLDSGVSEISLGILRVDNRAAGGLAIANTPAGNIAAATVQEAINELDTEKAANASPVFTGVASFPAGSAALPSIIPTGDPNTGVWFPAADTVAVSTSGLERMRVDTSGNVGLGVTPSAWGASWKALDAGSASGFASLGANTFALNNLYHDGTNYRTKTTARGQSYLFGTGGLGAHTFYSFDSVTAGGVATPRQLGGFNDAGDFTLNTATGTLGYGTGAGGTVTQATSRTTGVTLNKPTGAITLFTAAGSAIAATFTVTNSLVAATDVPTIAVRSATNKYITAVTNVAAGSFDVTFFTTGGVSSDAPIFQFNLGKGVSS